MSIHIHRQFIETGARFSYIYGDYSEEDWVGENRPGWWIAIKNGNVYPGSPYQAEASLRFNYTYQLSSIYELRLEELHE